MNTLNWPCCCCAAQICVTIAGQCTCDGGASSGPLSGAEVELKDPEGNVVGTQTTGETGEVCWDIGSETGTFTVKATWTNGQEKTTTVEVTTCHDYDVGISFLTHIQGTVNGCTGPISGASVTCGDASTTTDGSGHFCLDFSSAQPAADEDFGDPVPSPPVTVTIPTGPSQTHGAYEQPGFPVPCTYIFNFVDEFCIEVEGCAGPLQEAAWTLTCNGESFAGTTDATGAACVTPTTDWHQKSFSLTATKARFNPGTATGTAVGGAGPCGAGVVLSPGTGMHCCSCSDPEPDTLFCTTDFGTIALPQVASGSGCLWQACQTGGPINRGCGMGNGNVTILISVTLDNTGTWHVSVCWPVSNLGTNPCYWYVSTCGCNCIKLGGQGATIDCAGFSPTLGCSVPVAFSGALPGGGVSACPITSLTVTE